MSSSLKRKRDHSRSSTSASVSGVAPARPSSDTVVRTQLEQSLSDLNTATARIESLLALLPPTRSPLTDRSAPPQPLSAPPPCSSCSDLAKQLATLRAQAAQHERERESWKAFKKWWLDSLEKRERRRSDRRGDGGMERLVKRLDERTRRVWVDAGMVSEQQQEEQSEMTLPVHPTAAKRGEKGKGAALDVPSTSVAQAMSHEQGEQGSTSASPSPPPAPPKKNRTTNAPSASTSTTTPHPPNPQPTTAPYIDTTPIRNPHHRRTLHASACPDCALFYTHLNASTTTADGDASRTACSRHRSTFQRAHTPDGYWNIGFPTTQEADEVNANARSARGA